ncbi:hypothetical protein [Roseomonas sp. AR75]|jgi:hypothetical protein|uniref:hypothetical protein n=1 Tax=Roseomonas sp. AR75 TaxID=2562311 RepID=UPI0010BFBD24|nr:hypothetical protein [Roseomonas sp. AR75]
MPVPGGYGSPSPLLSRAVEEARQNVANSVNGLNVDEQTANTLGVGGICSGIAISWVIMFLNNVQEAKNRAGFESVFTVLRYQGAYFQELDYAATGSVADAERYNKVAKHNMRALPEVAASDVNTVAVPTPSHWAAVLEIWGHSIGVGAYSGEYFIMDPNFGLFRYTSFIAYRADLKQLVEARRVRKLMGPTDTVRFYFFVRAA